MKLLFRIGAGSERFQPNSRALESLLTEMQALGLIRFGEVVPHGEPEPEEAA